MRRFVEGIDRGQATLFPECLEDWIDQDTPVRAIDAFVGKLDLPGVGFDGVDPEATGRPSYHPSVLLKLYIYGYVNRVQSSRRLEREAGRNVEVMWLTCRLIPDHKTIADFRKDNGLAIKQVCVQFVELCRQMGLLTTASVAIDGSHRDGTPCSRLQSHPGDEHHGHSAADGCDPGIVKARKLAGVAGSPSSLPNSSKCFETTKTHKRHWAAAR